MCVCVCVCKRSRDVFGVVLFCRDQTVFSRERPRPFFVLLPVPSVSKKPAAAAIRVGNKVIKKPVAAATRGNRAASSSLVDAGPCAASYSLVVAGPCAMRPEVQRRPPTAAAVAGPCAASSSLVNAGPCAATFFDCSLAGTSER